MKPTAIDVSARRGVVSIPSIIHARLWRVAEFASEVIPSPVAVADVLCVARRELTGIIVRHLEQVVELDRISAISTLLLFVGIIEDRADRASTLFDGVVYIRRDEMLARGRTG